MSKTIIAPNLTKQALKNGQSVVGTMVAEIRQPSIMQLLAHAGFDFVIVDNEHGPFTIETIADLCRAGRAAGVTPLVRVPAPTYVYIAQSLDSGAQGVMIPRITTAQQVREVVKMMKYPPMGVRGTALSRGYTNFLSGSLPEAMSQANEETMLIVQVEYQEVVENIEEIVSVPGVDVALIGPTDLSISLGIPGQMEHPELQAAIEKVIAACQKHGVYPAIHINRLELADYWAKKGMRLISSGAEISFILKAGREVASTVKRAFTTTDQ